MDGDQHWYLGKRQMQTGKQPSGRAAYRNLYKTKRWQQLRKIQLSKHPHCQCPHHKGKRVPGNIVDHITPHKGDTRLFFDPNNLQTLTKTCHDKFKQSEERGGKGFNQGSDKLGNPLNPMDHWR